MKPVRPSARGMTLIELIVFIVIVSVGLAGVLSTFNVSVRGSADPLIRKQALIVAEAVLLEIMQKSFQNDPADANNSSATEGCTPLTTPKCSPNTPADRGNYNDVDDYNGYSQTGITQLDGTTVVAGLNDYTIAISVTPTALGPAGNQVASSNSKLIAVTVARGSDSVTLNAYRTNYE